MGPKQDNVIYVKILICLLIKDFHTLTAALNDLYDAPIKSVIADLGGWPVLGGWNEADFDLERVLGILSFYQEDPLIKPGVEVDYKNSEKYMFVVSTRLKRLPFYFDCVTN